MNKIKYYIEIETYCSINQIDAYVKRSRVLLSKYRGEVNRQMNI